MLNLQKKVFLLMLTITPKHLIYISISLGVIVLLTTIGMILFPKQFKKRDQLLAFTGKEKKWKTSLALFINNAITPLTVSIFYLLISAVLIIMKEIRVFYIGLSSILIGSIGFWTVKRITQRPRPEKARIHFKDFSFPSGHTTAGFIFFLSIAIAFSRMIGLEYRETAFTFALICGTIVGRSRWYLHVHWLTDVIIGALLGIWCFIFSYLLFFYFRDAIVHAIEQVFFSL